MGGKGSGKRADARADAGTGALFDDRPWDDAFRARFLRQGLSNAEIAQAVEIAEKAWTALAALVEMRDRHYEVYGYEKQHYVIDDNAQWTRARNLLRGV